MIEPSAPAVAGSYGIAPPDHRLPDATQLGPVHLQIAELARSIAYYTDIIGLRVLDQHEGVARLGAQHDNRPLIVLHELPGARPVPPHGRLGLFHVAILLPDRASLGRFLTHLAERNEHAGMSDHFVSEALYLTDPDGLGLEIYADRPREQWQSRDRQLAMGTEPLDVRAVLAAADGVAWTGAPAGTTIGHVHLHVGDLAHASEFYHDTLGMDKMVWEYPGALFLAAGGYHHHLGTNTWARGADAAHANEARLMEWTIDVPSASDVQAVAASATKRQVAVRSDGDAIVLQDPWGTTVRVRPAVSA
ncbi:MAG: VOC family protein [Gemmatimonadaceae bacterium]|nr:VOC family protein [Gemmatimonadaceae bacterium]